PVAGRLRNVGSGGVATGAAAWIGAALALPPPLPVFSTTTDVSTVIPISTAATVSALRFSRFASGGGGGRGGRAAADVRVSGERGASGGMAKRSRRSSVGGLA